MRDYCAGLECMAKLGFVYSITARGYQMHHLRDPGSLISFFNMLKFDPTYLGFSGHIMHAPKYIVRSRILPRNHETNKRSF